MVAIVHYSPSALESLSERVKMVIERRGVVAIPTETYYGLGVDPFNQHAVDRLIAVKGRDEEKPILVLIGALEQLSVLAKEVSSIASATIEAFWPGPLTILFPACPSLPSNLTAGTGLIGVRLTSCQPSRELLQRVGPLTGTSANRRGAPPARMPETVQEVFGEEVELIVDAGPTPGGLPSSVIDLFGSPARLIREGTITREAIESSLRTRGFSLKVF